MMASHTVPVYIPQHSDIIVHTGAAAAGGAVAAAVMLNTSTPPSYIGGVEDFMHTHKKSRTRMCMSRFDVYK